MSEIYSNLPSPAPTTADDLDKVTGMRSRLYKYQQETVAEMLRHELSPQLQPDPTYLKVDGVQGDSFFIQPTTLEILCECPMVDNVRGGILCEELGTGKTVMMLGLILATRDELTQPEDNLHEMQHVITPLSLRHFPYEVVSNERARLGVGRRKTEGFHILPSLLDIMIDFCSVRRQHVRSRTRQAELEARHLWLPLQHNIPFYHHSMHQREHSKTRQKHVSKKPRRIYLSGATLVVVPLNLLGQWENEIMKHCDDTISVCVLRTNDLMPLAVTLCQYDIILLAINRFTKEAERKDVDKLHDIPTICRCPEYSRSCVPLCRCNSHPDVSPIFQVRWKRLVVDEGHIASNLDSNLMHLMQTLNVERKWIMTGTPTTHLLGLDFGQGSDLVWPADETAEDEDSMPIVRHDEVTRCWSRNDREDLRKLSVMISKFLKVPLFALPRGIDTFTSLITEPLMDKIGPLPGAIRILEQVMHMVMIRHRSEDVERDVLLPLLVHDTIILDLDIYAARSYNAIQAGIAINAVDSERVDQDYLFHPRNKSSLAQVIENMSQSLFWHTNEDEHFGVDEMFLRSGEHMQTMRDRKTHVGDVELVTNALRHVRDAVNDRTWHSLQDSPYVFHRTSGVSMEVLAPCALHPYKWLEIGFISSNRLTDLRDLVYKQPLIDEKRIAAWAVQANKTAALHLRWAQIELKQRKSGSRNNQGESTVAQRQLVKADDLKERRKELQQEWNQAIAHLKALATLEEDENGHFPTTSTFTNSRITFGISPERASMLARSPLANVRVLNSTSSKLDYILNEVRAYSRVEKFLIFSKSPVTLALVQDGLAMIGVKNLVYHSLSSAEKVGPREREQRVTTFETSETYRVFLMELKYGARGLNLVSASRVIFCEPVWQPDVEAQAIKRVHRIGQTQVVTVKTLAIRGTYEEIIMQRNDAVKGQQADLLDDLRMRDFIANPTFIEVPETKPFSRLDIPLIDIPDVVEPRDIALASAAALVRTASEASTNSAKRGAELFFEDLSTPPEEPPLKRQRLSRVAPDNEETEVLLVNDLVEPSQLSDQDKERVLRVALLIRFAKEI